MEEKNLSGEESLKLINRMIYEAKGYFHESGLSGIIYGVSIFICCVLAWLFEKGTIDFPFHPLLLMTPVFFIQGWVQYKEEKKKKAKTFTDEAIDYVWLAYFLSVFAALCGNFVNAGYIIITSFIINCICFFYYRHAYQIQVSCCLRSYMHVYSYRIFLYAKRKHLLVNGGYGHYGLADTRAYFKGAF